MIMLRSVVRLIGGASWASGGLCRSDRIRSRESSPSATELPSGDGAVRPLTVTVGAASLWPSGHQRAIDHVAAACRAGDSCRTEHDDRMTDPERVLHAFRQRWRVDLDDLAAADAVRADAAFRDARAAIDAYEAITVCEWQVDSGGAEYPRPSTSNPHWAGALVKVLLDARADLVRRHHSLRVQAVLAETIRRAFERRFATLPRGTEADGVTLFEPFGRPGELLSRDIGFETAKEGFRTLRLDELPLVRQAIRAEFRDRRDDPWAEKGALWETWRAVDTVYRERNLE